MAFSAELDQAVGTGKILPSAAENLNRAFEAAPEGSFIRNSITELMQQGEFTEINDRFYKTLAFGTGGIRGRTIGKYVTDSELGTPTAQNRPEHACVGSNAMNDANVERATRGLCRYLRKAFPEITPVLVIAHDTRHFSRHFAELTAKVATNEGVSARLFPEERSTPQLSFTVRHLNAQAGVVVTASHNPAHDNGYKVYFDDGAQIVEPHAGRIIAEVNAAVLSPDLSPKPGTSIETLGSNEDNAYLDALEDLVLDRVLLRNEAAGLKVVFTPIHGTGIQSVRPILERFKVTPILVEEQLSPDGRFPTVKSPNPENSEALSLGIIEAKKYAADVVIATDPDSDRMGVAVRNREGQYELITGNQIGTLLAHYRVTALFNQGILTKASAHHACLIKTFVTTDIQAAIAEKFGLKIINTLTGFKYIGEKLRLYEEQLLRARPDLAPYRNQPADVRRAAHLESGCFFVFGGEESYGYSGGDYCRDKDANAAALMLVESLAYAKSKGITLLEYLDLIYGEFGYYKESLGQIVLEGAEGAAKIRKLLESYPAHPPDSFLGEKVIRIENFSTQDIYDGDGRILPRELMLIFHLGNGARVAVRGSGTEPKVKYYLFANAKPEAGKLFTPEQLTVEKKTVNEFLLKLWPLVERDALQRAG